MQDETISEIDYDCLEKLKVLMDEDYPELIANFLVNTGISIEEIAAAMRAGNRQAVSATAHRMRSSSGQLGFRRLQHIAKALEYSADTSDAELNILLAELRPVYERAQAFLKQHINSN